MSLLPPVGWADVATKDDLRMLGLEVSAEITELRTELRDEIAQARTELGRQIAHHVAAARVSTGGER